MPFKRGDVLTPKVQELIAISASIAGNCLKSLRYHFLEAMKAGCKMDEIEEAVNIARSIKERPINDIYEIAINLLSEQRDGVEEKVDTSK
jgi:AhpD family alkylhydroperoxidase